VKLRDALCAVVLVLASGSPSGDESHWKPNIKTILELDAKVLKLRLQDKHLRIANYTRYYMVSDDGRTVIGGFIAPVEPETRRHLEPHNKPKPVPGLPPNVYVASDMLQLPPGIADGGCDLTMDLAYDVKSRAIVYAPCAGIVPKSAAAPAPTLPKFIEPPLPEADRPLQ